MGHSDKTPQPRNAPGRLLLGDPGAIAAWRIHQVSLLSMVSIFFHLILQTSLPVFCSRSFPSDSGGGGREARRSSRKSRIRNTLRTDQTHLSHDEI